MSTLRHSCQRFKHLMPNGTLQDLQATKCKKIRLFLCLINQAQRHEDVWGSGGIATSLTPALDGGEYTNVASPLGKQPPATTVWETE
jgi:hypothetical protein